jgi:hypothetical protein
MAANAPTTRNITRILNVYHVSMHVEPPVVGQRRHWDISQCADSMPATAGAESRLRRRQSIPADRGADWREASDNADLAAGGRAVVLDPGQSIGA